MRRNSGPTATDGFGTQPAPMLTRSTGLSPLRDLRQVRLARVHTELLAASPN
jgi:hypothetical protein